MGAGRLVTYRLRRVFERKTHIPLRFLAAAAAYIRMSDCYQIIYVSAALAPFTLQQLEELLAFSRRRNHSEGLSGLLLYEDGSFLQVLEGPEGAVRRTFQRIERDPRHHRVTRVFGDHRSARMFPEWSMGYPKLDALGTERPEGYTDFFAAQQKEVEPDGTMAAQIVEAFRAGRWHVHVSDG